MRAGYVVALRNKAKTKTAAVISVVSYRNSMLRARGLVRVTGLAASGDLQLFALRSIAYIDEWKRDMCTKKTCDCPWHA